MKRRTGSNNAALQAAISLAFVVPAAAQPAPNAQPQGGQVVRGSAAIATGATTTTITQSSHRAAIDWRSFDVGSNQSVVFQQPGASSVTLNRVAGPDPSAIAGRISANGQLVLTNPSGVTFYAGSQVNAQSVIVSAAGISNHNFMAGRMVFDRSANPNARIENAGTITVKEAGLAALVAPSVANSGTITARLGHVVLAGAAAHTLDMYGDGLVSIDITKQVTLAPVGPGGKAVTALVTNTGTIAADGGTIQLTASAADGLVSTLVQARGRIQANTAGGRTGQIEIAGTGGSVVIEGRVAADGRAPGTAGGSVAVAGSDATFIAPAARITASGRAGGGTVAVGTTLARARGTGPAPAGTSARTIVAAGARISADATATGDGGRVTVLSTQSTSMGGAVTARGGPAGGNGGMVELSGETGFGLTGSADTSAPHGTLGTVLMDPRDLTITSTTTGTNAVPTNGVDPNIGYAQGGTTTDAYVTPAQIQALTGNVRLQATRDLVVASDLTYGNIEGGVGTGGNLTLEAGRNLTVNSGVTITVPGFQGGSSRVPGVVTLTAAAVDIPGFDPAGTLTLLGNVNTSSLNLRAGTGGIVLGGALDTTYVSGRNLIDMTTISTPGALTQTVRSSLTTGNLVGTASSVSLTATGNQIASIGGLSPSLTGGTPSGTSAPFTTTAGGVTIVDSVPLTVGSSSAGTAQTGITVPTGQTISLQADSLALQSGGVTIPALSASGGTVALQPFTAGQGIVLTSSTTKPTGSLALTTAETGLIAAPTLQLAGATSNVTFGQTSETSPVDLVAHGNFSQLLLTAGGAVTQTTALVVNSLSNAGNTVNLASVTLQNSGNSIPAVGSLTVNGVLALSTSGPLSVSGTVTANAGLTLTSSGNMTVLASGYLSGPNGLNLIVDNAGTGSLSIAGTVTSNRGTSLTAGTGGIGLSGSVVPGQSLQITSAGPFAETGGGTIVGGTLNGTATSVSLPSRSNSLGGVSGFTVSSGDFLLVNSTPLQVFSPGNEGNDVGLTMQTGRTVTLVTDSLAINNDSGTSTGDGGGFGISAGGGTLVVAPFTAGGNVLLTSGAKPTTGLSLTTSELALVDASTLQIGGASGSATQPRAGAVTVGQAGDGTIDLGVPGFTRLTLNATGAVTQNAALGVTTLAGTASSLALADVGNFITELNGFAATAGDIALHTSSGLTVSNAATASGNLTLSSVAVVTGRTDSTALLLAANVSGGTVRFDTTDGNGGANGILQTAGIVTAGTLTGAASTVVLPQANQITNLGDFTTTGALAVSDGRALAVTGTVNASAGAVTLNAPGITQTSTSSITTPELDGSATADTVLDSRLNAVSTMGTFNQTGGSFTLVTSLPELDFGGNTGQVSATTGSLTFVADAVGIVARPPSGTSISATAGLITFAPFTPSRPIALINTGAPASNALSLSFGFRSYLHGDTLGLGRAGYDGPISLGGVGQTINLSAFRALQVQTSGAVTQGAGGVLTVSSLNGSAGSISLPGNNNFAALGLGIGGAGVGLAATSGALTLGTVANLSLYGPVSASTAVTLTTATTAGLTVVGSLTAPTVTLLVGGAVSQSSASSVISTNTLSITAASAALPGTGNQIATLTSAVSGNLALTDATALNITGGSTIGGTLNLTVAGAITGGTVSAQALTGSANSVALTAAGNQIGSLGPFTSTGGFNLVDARSLTVAGAVSDPTVISLNVTGDLTLAGALSGAPGTVTLNASGAITQPGGAITAGTLTGSASSVALTTAGNQIASLGPFTTTGGFSLADATALTVNGAVSDPTAISLNVSSNLTLAAALSSASGTVTLNASRTITQTGGAISASSLSVTAASAALPGTGNRFATLTSAVSGNLTLTDATALNITGGSTVGGTLNLTVAGAVTGGNVTAQALTGSANSVTLTATGNQIASLGPFTTTGGFSLTDATSLTVAGTVSDPAAISLNVGGNLTLAGALSDGQGTVTLNSAGTITQTGGAITAGTLIGNATGSVLLGQAGNSVATLTSAVSGNLTLTDAIALNITGGSTVGGTLNLTVAGAVTGGTITAQALTGSANSVTLTATGNQIASLGPFTTSGGFSLVDATALTVAGTVTDPAAISLNVGGNLTLAGALSGGQGTVTLNSAGTITQTGGAITAGTLIGNATGSVLLGQAGNSVATLTSAVSGNLTLTDASSLNITGGSTVGGTLNLAVAGAVTGGSITAQALTGSANSVILTASGNQIASLGPFTTMGGFSLVDATSLTVAGTVSDPAAISLNVGGNLTLAGALSGGQGTVTLNSAGTITQPGGAITADTLTGSATGAAILGQAGNSIATLAGFTTGGDFTLADARTLVVSAPVDPNTVSLTIKGDLFLNSTLTGNTVVLDVTGAIVEGPGGRIIADTLTSRAGSVALNGNNQIATFGAFTTTAGFSLTTAGALTIAGPLSDATSVSIAASGPITLASDVSAPTISLSAAGNITQTAGSLVAAGTLTISASGALTQSGGNFAAGTLTGSADSIDLGRGGPAAIGQITGLTATGQSPGTLTVVDNMPLRISGVIAGRFVSVTAAGSLVLADGTVIRTDGRPSSAELGSTDAIPGSNLSVSPGPDGRATLTQAGVVTVAPQAGPVATLRIDLPPSGGTVALNNLQAASADLILSLGNGAATGRLVARNLTVLGARGQASLSGTVRGLSGDQAAGTSALLPGLDLRYTLNGCAISLTSCSATTGGDVPSIFQPGAAIASAISSVIRPDILALDVLDLSVTRDRDDPTLLLPNISDKDY